MSDKKATVGIYILRLSESPLVEKPHLTNAMP